MAVEQIYLCQITHCRTLYCIVFILYLYSVQNLHLLQDSQHYMIHLTAQVQPNSKVTDIPLTERQRLKDDYYQRPWHSLACHWV